jgi:flagellar hook assembly protein FlgD
MENPASESTTFVVEHDRPAENVSVTLKVVSTDGREVWSTSAEDTSRSGICLVNWNLADTKGSKVSPGLYLVYAILEDENGAQRKAVNKLIIVSR